MCLLKREGGVHGCAALSDRFEDIGLLQAAVDAKGFSCGILSFFLKKRKNPRENPDV